MVGYAEATSNWPLVGLVIGVLIAGAIAYGMYRGALTHQPGQVLQIHRRVPDRRRGGNPRLRHRRPADRQLAARPGRQGLRHHRLVQLVLLVRRDHPGHLQRHAHPDRAAAGRLAGLPRRGAGAVPASHRRRPPARRNRPPHPTPPPKGPPREGPTLSRRDRGGTGRTGPEQLPGQGRAGRSRGRQGRARTDHRRGVRHVVRTLRHPGRYRRQHLRDQQQRLQGHRVLRLRRGRTGDGRGGEHLPRAGTQARRPAHSAGHLSDGVQARHGRRRHPQRLHRHRGCRADRHRRQVQGRRRQLQAVRQQPDRRAGGCDRRVRRRGQGRRHRQGQVALPGRAHLLRAHRTRRRVLPQRSRPAHRPARGRSGARPAVDRLPPAREGPVGQAACSPTPTRSPISWSPTSRNSTPG